MIDKTDVIIKLSAIIDDLKTRYKSAISQRDEICFMNDDLRRQAKVLDESLEKAHEGCDKMDKTLNTKIEEQEKEKDMLEFRMVEGEKGYKLFKGMYNDLAAVVTRHQKYSMGSRCGVKDIKDAVITISNMRIKAEKEATNYRLKLRRLEDCIKRNIDDSTEGILSDVLRQFHTNERTLKHNRGK